MILIEKIFNIQALIGLKSKEGRMLTCPHCQGRGLRHVFNVFMDSFGKASCHVCGQVVGVSPYVKWTIQCLCYGAGLLSLLLALIMNTAWPLLVYAGILLHLFIFAMFRFDLVELKDSELDLANEPFKHSQTDKRHSDKS